MAIYENSFKIQREFPHYRVSRMFPELTFAIWCNRNRDLIEISSDEGPEASEEIKLSIGVLKRELGLKVARQIISDSSAQIVTQTCGCRPISNSTANVIERNNCLKMEPIFFKKGWGFYRVLSFHNADVKNMFNQLESVATVKVISRNSLSGSPVRDTFAISANGLLGGLTKKQSLALRTALVRGYYDIPKRVSTDEIAKNLGLPRTTFEEHLRKAESKAMRGIMPLLMFARTAAPKSKGRVPHGVEQELVTSIAA